LLCSSNHSFELHQGPWSCWKRPLPSGNIISMKGCVSSASVQVWQVLTKTPPLTCILPIMHPGTTSFSQQEHPDRSGAMQLHTQQTVRSFVFWHLSVRTKIFLLDRNGHGHPWPETFHTSCSCGDAMTQPANYHKLALVTVTEIIIFPFFSHSVHLLLNITC